MVPRTIRIEKAKYDGSYMAAWESQLLDQNGSALRTRVPAGAPVYLMDQGRWVKAMETVSVVEIYFEDRWYNLYHFREPTTDPDRWHCNLLWYCNVAMPARFDGKTVRFVDLDIDVLCTLDGALAVRDEDEFEQHRVELGYSDEVVEHALAARDEVLRLACECAFPFDYETQVGASG